MTNTDLRIDAYIEKSGDFAKPILSHLRKLVHDACPDAEETLKWNLPAFMYKGKILCGIAAFKQHCIFNLWLGALVIENDSKANHAMGQLGKIKSVKDLPKDTVIVRYLKQAMKLTSEGKTQADRVKSKKSVRSKDMVIPDYIISAFKTNKIAKSNFEKASPSFRKEYVDWITEAKTVATRNKRIATALEWIAEGKHRNWKYMK